MPTSATRASVGAQGALPPYDIYLSNTGADHERRRFLLRVSSAGQRQHLAGQLGAAYPQAQLRLLDLESGVADPARLGDDEQLAACTLGLRAAPYLPLRIFGDRDLDADAGPAQADPVLGILAALADLPPGWRGLAQLVLLQPAPSNWAEPYRRLALESPVQAERAGDRGPSLVGPLLLLGLAGLALVGSSVAAAWQQGDWLGVLGADQRMHGPRWSGWPTTGAETPDDATTTPARGRRAGRRRDRGRHERGARQQASRPARARTAHPTQPAAPGRRAHHLHSELRRTSPRRSPGRRTADAARGPQAGRLWRHSTAAPICPPTCWPACWACPRGRPPTSCWPDWRVSGWPRRGQWNWAMCAVGGRSGCGR